MLANSHSPNGLDECGAGVPCMHSNATVPKRPPGHRCPREEESRGHGYAAVSSDWLF